MRKPGPNFKMSKFHKTLLGKIRDPHKRGEMKRGLIDAILTGDTKVTKDKNDKKGH